MKTGDAFGDYKVVRLLGKGGMGEVWLLEGRSGRQVAAKILEATADHEARKRFLREAQLALGVKHPNLVETYDVGEDPETGLCYILMEYVPGGTLADYIKSNGALAIEDAVAVVEAIAGVLELGRQKGIVHRDIKPANIMFDAEGTPKLADLGIARAGNAGTETTTVTQTGAIIGTPAYMSPEQMLDSHNVDTRADIYSLGVVFFEMLTGQRPNKDDTIVQLMAKAMKGEPLPDVRTLRPEVSASLAQLLNMMVAPDKDGRISTPGQITSALAIIERGGDAASTSRRRNPSAPDSSPAGRAVAPRPPDSSPSGFPKWLMPVLVLAALAGAFSFLAPKKNGLSANSSAQTVVKEVVRTNIVDRNVVRTNVVARIVETTNITRRILTNVEKGVDVPKWNPNAEGHSDLAEIRRDSGTRRASNLRVAVVDDRRWYYSLQGNEATIEAGSRNWIPGRDNEAAVEPKPTGHLMIPSELDGHPVVCVGPSSFVSCPDLVSVMIPKGVRQILAAFLDCRSLQSVHIPETIQRLDLPFSGCPSLMEIDIGSCPKLGVIVSCPNLNTVRVSERNPRYRSTDGVLYDRELATLVFHPRTERVARISHGASGVGVSAFDSCSIETLRVPSNVKKISTAAFNGCNRLVSVDCEEGLTEVGQLAFQQCQSLRSVTLPASLKSLSSSAFNLCKSLEVITFRGEMPEGALPLSRVPSSLRIEVLHGKGSTGKVDRFDSAALADPDTTRATQKALDALFPGWMVSAVEPSTTDWAFGYQKNWRGRSDVITTMPVRYEDPCVLSRTVKVTGRHPVLAMEVASHSEYVDFLLTVKVNGKVVLGPRVVCTPDDAPYERLIVPLSRWKGRNVRIEILHTCNNWWFEHAFWGQLQIAEGTGKESAGAEGVMSHSVFPRASLENKKWRSRSVWKYTEREPTGNWILPSFDDSKWRQTKNPLGRDKGDAMKVADRWQSERIWLRRKFNWNEPFPVYKATIDMFYDQDVEMYLNGTLVYTHYGWNGDWLPYAIWTVPFADALRQGENVLAVTVKGDGPSYFDCGLSIETWRRSECPKRVERKARREQNVRGGLDWLNHPPSGQQEARVLVAGLHDHIQGERMNQLRSWFGADSGKDRIVEFQFNGNLQNIDLQPYTFILLWSRNPKNRYSDEEIRQVERYLDKGGNLMVVASVRDGAQDQLLRRFGIGVDKRASLGKLKTICEAFSGEPIPWQPKGRGILWDQDSRWLPMIVDEDDGASPVLAMRHFGRGKMFFLGACPWKSFAEKSGNRGWWRKILRGCGVELK